MTRHESAPSSTAPRTVTQRRDWLGVGAVMIGIFLLVTAEQLPIGLLSQVADSLSVTSGTAGLLITVPGVVAAFAAPLLPVAVGRLDRRWLLTGLMTLMTLASLLGALADGFAMLLATRVLVGVCIGGFWAIAGGLASRLVALEQVPRAMSLIFSGVAGASVLGVPAGTWLGEHTDWRIAFGSLAGLSLLVTIALWRLLPSLPAQQPVRLSNLAGQFASRGVRVGVAATALIVMGHFAAYTFVSPILQEIAGIPLASVSALLLCYGAAGLLGNFLAGTAAGRRPYATVLVIPLLLAIATLAFPWLGREPAAAIGLLMLWGAVFGSISVSLQTWILKSALNTEAATALMAFVFNLSIGIGAMAGGRVVDAIGLSGVLLGAGGLFVLAAALVARTPSRVVGPPQG
ncbi:MFS transporter [Halomonas sp. ND22Bw]|uniref:Transporter n=1 Tax=Halomonas salina TaxID=42565 RepID=A0ABR4WWZ5_9GAMM|nr:MFS transporter [Halomonas salina]KGE79248.1 transporter [Halomonas salina]PSJ20807.1 MFS transporter [Halomonas sp. ND22Bw]